MPKPGPKPRPTALKKLQGNPGKRALPANEPKPKTSKSAPRAPSYLSKPAQKEWRRISKELHTLGLLTKVDIPALAAYCQCFATWVDANEKIQKHGVLIKAQSGFPMQSPYLAIANKAMVEMRKWLVEFGMTPSARSRVEVSSDDEADPMEEFLKSGGKPKVVK